MVNAKILDFTYRAERPVVEIVNQGQIKRLTLPEGWSEDDKVRQADIGSRSLRQFSPKGRSDVTLYCFYRGFPIDPSDGASLVSVLIRPAHTLSPAEIKSLAAVLGQRANSDSFTILSLRTEDLNGRKALVLEGRYNELQQDLYEIFVDAEGTGQAVQEIYLLAPKEEYMLYLSKIKAALKTIQWKPTATGKN